MKKIRVMQIGLGPLGQKITRYILERDINLELVAAVDINPEILGTDVAKHAGLDEISVTIKDSVAEAQKEARADVAVLTTVSSVEKLLPQIEEITAAGLPVVSTCEELLFPYETNPKVAEEIDALAKKAGVAVVGTGVNPGFLMDSLPSFMTSVCQSVDRIVVERFQDATFRRLPFQLKIGAGKNKAEFEELVSQKIIRHVGLTESVQFIADCLGWKLDKVEDIVTPVIYDKDVASKEIEVPAGVCAGVHQLGLGWKDGEKVIELIFHAAIATENPRDTIKVFGEPDIESTIAGGVNGDVATCAITLNAIASTLKAQPGLQTMGTVPLVSHFNDAPALKTPTMV